MGNRGGCRSAGYRKAWPISDSSRQTDVPCSMALARFLSLYEEKTKTEVATLSRDLRYALRLAEMYPLQGLLLTEEKMKVYGKAVSPFYAMLHYEGLPDAVEIFFEEYVNEAFFFHKKEKRKLLWHCSAVFLTMSAETAGI